MPGQIGQLSEFLSPDGGAETCTWTYTCPKERDVQVFDDLIVELDPPPNRRAKCTGGKERHLTEAAVMLAYGIHLSQTVPALTTVELHPVGEHAKRFEIARWLSARGFVLKESQSTTAYCGTYVRDQQVMRITSIPGKGDVVAKTREAPENHSDL
jgi:hypothetical protein